MVLQAGHSVEDKKEGRLHSADKSQKGFISLQSHYRVTETITGSIHYKHKIRKQREQKEQIKNS